MPLSTIRGRVLLWEFAAMAYHLPRESAVWRSINGPEQADWGLAEQLLASGVDALEWLVWAKTSDGAKNRNRPKPIPRPGVDDGREVKHFGGDAVPITELVDFLGWESQMTGPDPD